MKINIDTDRIISIENMIKIYNDDFFNGEYITISDDKKFIFRYLGIDSFWKNIIYKKDEKSDLDIYSYENELLFSGYKQTITSDYRFIELLKSKNRKQKIKRLCSKLEI